MSSPQACVEVKVSGTWMSLPAPGDGRIAPINSQYVLSCKDGLERVVKFQMRRIADTCTEVIDVMLQICSP
jgi:hypothetical protein